MIRQTIAIFLVLSGLLLTLQAAEVSAQLSLDEVAEGKGSILSLTVEGGRPDAQPMVPKVAGLVMKLRGQTQQVQIVNGRMSRAIIYSYLVGSNKAGEYQIPVITVKVGGEELVTKPLSITVTPAPGEGKPAGMEEGETDAPDDKKYGFLHFELVTQDREYVYPGEIAPVRIRAYFPAGAGVSLNSPPRPNGQAFTLHNLSKGPTQSMEVVDGKRYLVVTWYGGLSATKAGRYPASFSLEGTVTVRDRSQRRRRPSPFDDPLLGGSIMDDFFAPMIPKEVMLQTEEVRELEVKELPKEGRPSDFSGAIGEFEFVSLRIPNELTTGEPVQVNARLRGKGNFALLKQPEPQPADEWKVYQGKDQFVAGDLASFSGAKSFQYSVVPKVPGQRVLEFGFSFFNPDTGEYRTVKSSAGKVIVSGDLIVEVEEAVVLTPSPEEIDLAPLRTHLGGVLSYRALSENVWYRVMLVGCGVLAIGILGLEQGSRWYQNPERLARREQDRRLSRTLEAAEVSSNSGDEAGFFVAARDALRLSLAQRVGVRPEAVTLAELDGVDEPEMLALMREADRLDYSGRVVNEENLLEWNGKLRDGVARLTGKGGRYVS